LLREFKSYLIKDADAKMNSNPISVHRQPIGLYIHIPFCVRKCPYCDFYSLAYSADKAREYTDAVVRNLLAIKDTYGENLLADTLYFGGGTPILLGEELIRILDAAKCILTHTDGIEPEISFEANPNSTDYNVLSSLNKSGFNRISIGVQSLVDSELLSLGRLHSSKDAIAAVEIARSAGFRNISIDLMLGIPHQTISSIDSSINAISNLDIDHISVYMLGIEEGTPFHANNVIDSCPDEELTTSIYSHTLKRLNELGLSQYEISNFAKDGFQCRHNLKYWRCDNYIGIGTSAHSFLNGERFAVPSDIDEFIKSPLQPTFTTDDNAGGFDEFVMLGLRLNEGISANEAACRKFSGEFMQLKQRAESLKGFATVTGDTIKLTEKGFLLSNEVIAKLL